MQRRRRAGLGRLQGRRDSVTSHEAWGLGSYCYFSTNPSVVLRPLLRGAAARRASSSTTWSPSRSAAPAPSRHVINNTGRPVELRDQRRQPGQLPVTAADQTGDAVRRRSDRGVRRGADRGAPGAHDRHDRGRGRRRHAAGTGLPNGRLYRPGRPAPPRRAGLPAWPAGDRGSCGSPRPAARCPSARAPASWCAPPA